MLNDSVDFLKNLSEMLSSLSKGHRLIAKYIIDHYEKASYMTASKLGEAVGTSESTVVRFAVELGYDGYPHLQKLLQEYIKGKLTSVQRIEVSMNRIDEDNILKSVLRSDAEKIKTTMEEVDNNNFKNIVNEIISAEKIYIIAVRSAAPLASFMGFYFNLIFENVSIVHTTDESEMFEQTFRASKGDIVIGISFPRYSNRTIKALEYVGRNGAKTIAITDSLNSPLANVADLVITARSDMASFADSLVAPLSVINAIIVAVGMKKKEALTETLEKLEKLWGEYHVYETNESHTK